MAHILTLHHPERTQRHYLSKVWQADTMYAMARRHASERGRAFALREA